MSIIQPTYSPDTVMEPIEAFACDLDGRNQVMVPGRDRVTADHELVKRYPTFFRPIEAEGGGIVKYQTEAATDNPGEQRARQRTARTTERET